MRNPRNNTRKTLKSSTIMLVALFILSVFVLSACGGANFTGYATGTFSVEGSTFKLQPSAQFCFTAPSTLTVNSTTTQNFIAGQSLTAETEVVIDFSTGTISGSFNAGTCDVNLMVGTAAAVPTADTGMLTDPGVDGTTNCAEAEKFVSGLGGTVNRKIKTCRGKNIKMCKGIKREYKKRERNGEKIHTEDKSVQRG